MRFTVLVLILEDISFKEMYTLFGECIVRRKGEEQSREGGRGLWRHVK